MKRRHFLLASSSASLGMVVASQANPQPRESTPTAPTSAGQTVQITQGLSGYYTVPSGQGPFPTVVVIMEAFGLNDYIKSICDRLSQAGYAALAPDFYHGAIYPYTDLKGAVAKLKTLKDNTVMAEFGQGLAFLVQRPEVKQGGVGVMGFCMGGRLTFLANAVHATQVKAAIAFYGGGISASSDPLGRADLLDQTEKMNAPLLLLYGAEDTGITPEEHQRIALALSKFKKRYSLNVFPNAKHGFFSDRRDSYNPEASAEAWAMTLSFLDRYLKGQG